MKPPIRLAILECDTPLPNTKARYGGYGGVFEALLQAGINGLDRPDITPSGLQLSCYQIESHPETYPALDDIDAILITGSSETRLRELSISPDTDSFSGHNSFDDTPWIKTLVDFTAKVLAQSRMRVIGVCYGHQIVGRALGVKVGRNPDGWETAVYDIQLTAKGKEIFQLEKLVRARLY
jgi:hypothetical protein